jgi:uncharacterized membrane protein
MAAHLMTPLLLGRRVRVDNGCHEALADDYTGIYFHLIFRGTFGRRLGRNHADTFMIQSGAYHGKVLVHPEATTDSATIVERAAIGPLPGAAAIEIGLACYLVLAIVALVTQRHSKTVGLGHGSTGEDRIVGYARTEIF